jgi:hypothetical protein
VTEHRYAYMPLQQLDREQEDLVLL